jgi:hypothetical protein
MPIFNKVLGECRLHTKKIKKHNSGDNIMEDGKGWDSSGI